MCCKQRLMSALHQAHASQRSHGRYKEKYTSMLERYERASKSLEVHQKEYEIANAKIKKLQAENDFLLDTLLFNEATYNRYIPPSPSELDSNRLRGHGPHRRERSNIFQDLPYRRGHPREPKRAPSTPSRESLPPAHGLSQLENVTSSEHQSRPLFSNPASTPYSRSRRTAGPASPTHSDHRNG